MFSTHLCTFLEAQQILNFLEQSGFDECVDAFQKGDDVYIPVSM